MIITGFDVETFLIAPGVAAPKLVCFSWDDGETQGVVRGEEGLDMFEKWIQDPNRILAAHNAPFDLGVLVSERPRLLSLVFQAIDEGRLCCTMTREMMIMNAWGFLKFEENELGEKSRSSFSLARCAQRRLKIIVEKKDTWRLRYGTLFNVPIKEWEQAAIDYAVFDSTIARELWISQECEVEPEGIPGEISQMQAAWALMLMRIWGVRTDEAPVIKYKAELEAEYIEHEKAAKEHGCIRPNGKRNMKQIRELVSVLYVANGLDLPFTPGENISTDRETLTMIKHPHVPPHPGLKAVSESIRLQKLLKTYIPILESGTKTAITPEWNAIIETYRTSCARPNLQNAPRAGSYRSCFVPRPGYVFAFCDYDTLEMRTLAQSCLDLFADDDDNESAIANAINEGWDLHVAVAADMLKIEYADAMKRYEDGDKVIADARQFSKIANYGFGGGMGPDAFVDYARGYGIEVSKDHSRVLWESFRTRWYEMKKYFSHCSDLTRTGDVERLIHPRTGLERGKVGYTQTCNHYFQHLAAMGAKRALYRTQKECYLDRSSPLYNCRPWYFGHDEIGMEIPETSAQAVHDAAMQLEKVMVEEMKFYCPDVLIGATVALGRRWLKGAKPLYRDGLLMPSKLIKNEAGKTEWVIDDEPVTLAA